MLAMARARLSHAAKLVELQRRYEGRWQKLRAVRSVAKLHIEDIPALAASGVAVWAVLVPLVA